MSLTLRKRTGKKATMPASTDYPEEIKTPKTSSDPIATVKEADSKYYVAMVVVTLLAIYTRFDNIGFPNKVVFDEVHFGKFASYYLEGTYFFDLHPPFAKLLIAAVGYVIGYDGKFKFDSIGDSYITNNVPYISYRAFLAIQGVVTIPVMFLTMKTLGFSVAACLLSSVLVCFDNAHVSEARLILLDATLILSIALTMFCYSKFSTYRKQPFGKKWWVWLTATGISLSCVISTKYVGLFTYLTIGIAVIHELWILLDYKRGLSNTELAKHFSARLWSLIILPFIIYLYWFYVHFQILSISGPGDSFMSQDFQETLHESASSAVSDSVNFYDVVTIKHRDTDAFLHSHLHQYPLRYESGRISSNLQQVTCVSNSEDEIARDPNNHWEIIPDRENIGLGVDVYTNDVVRFRHVGTGGYLLAHDVASPLKSTNEEFTIVYGEDAATRYNETLFNLRLGERGSSSNKRKLIKTKVTPIKVVHADTVVAMWTHNDELLPDWAFGQQEVSGNKKVTDVDNWWSISDIINMAPADIRKNRVPKVVKHMNFFKKWWELQFLMFHHNNQLTSEHPFASQPDSWPLSLSGVSFWNDNEAKQQIFFIGNIVGFWLEVCFLAIYVGLVLADQVTRRRNIILVNDKARSRLYNTLGFLFIGWCAHYLPFFLMNRQKFLHHYLPAHLIAALFSGALLEFISTDNSVGSKIRPRLHKHKLSILVSIFSMAIIWFFFYFRPITYGNVSLTPEEVQKRQWLDIKLHYAK